MSGSIRALRQSGGALRQLQLRASGTLGSGVNTVSGAATATMPPRGSGGSSFVAIAGGGSMPRPGAAAALLRASRDGWSGVLGAGAGAGSVAGAGAGASPSSDEGPLDSLKAMASRIEGLGRGLMELAEGRPRSARPRAAGGPTEMMGVLLPTAGGEHRLLLGQQQAQDSSFRRGLQPLEDVREGDDNEEYGVADDEGVEEGSAEEADEVEEGEVLGFKSSLPANPFGY